MGGPDRETKEFFDARLALSENPQNGKAQVLNRMESRRNKGQKEKRLKAKRWDPLSNQVIPLNNRCVASGGERKPPLIIC